MSAAKRAKAEAASNEASEADEAALKADEKEAPLENGANDGGELEGAAGEEDEENDYEYEAAENEFLSALEEVQEKLIEVLFALNCQECCTSSQRFNVCKLSVQSSFCEMHGCVALFPPGRMSFTTSLVTDGFIVLFATGE